MWVRGYVSMCFGDPWEGDVPDRPGGRVADRLLAMGCHAASIGDTIGVATPGTSPTCSARSADAGIRRLGLAVHFHDTYGQALANTLAALEAGVTTVDSSAGGLGGCPYAESATGNLATEDLVWKLHGLGIDTGVDLDALVATSVWMAGQLGRPSPSQGGAGARGAAGGARVTTALSPEHEELRATVERFARAEVAPVIGDLYERGEFPYDDRGPDGRHGPVRPAVPRGVRRDGRRLLRPVPGPRGAGPGGLVGGHHPRGGRGPRAPCRSTGSAPRPRSRSGCPGLCAGSDPRAPSA